MQDTFDKFLMLMGRNRQLVDSVHLLKSKITVDIDFSDIYRTQVVAALSALDFFVHEVVKIGILEQFDGKRAKTAWYNDFISQLVFPEDLATFAERRHWVNEKIVEIHSWKSFQCSDKISGALKKIIDPEFFWNAIAITLKKTPQFIKTDLDIKVRRRNQIVHEGDINPTYGTLWDISDKDSCEIVDFIELFCRTMLNVLI